MKKYKHNLSHDVKLSGNMGQIIPIACLEVLPGDEYRHDAAMLLRTAPLIAPVMHKVEADIFHFYVPNRIIWDDFEDFITGGPNGDDDTVAPYVTIPNGGYAVGSLADYLGLPTQMGQGLQVSALPFRAYGAIYNEWFRDEDLIPTERVVNTGNGSDTTTDQSFASAAWRRDYFTKARPTPQKGPDILIPLAGSAPVVSPVSGANNISVKHPNGSFSWMGTGSTFLTDNASPGSEASSLYADLDDVSAVSINDLRLASALQRYQEENSRFGNRYPEYLANKWGVKSSDGRLSLPELLGRGSQTIQFSEVLQTSATDSDQPLGQLGGHGISTQRTNRYRRFFEEHGYVISVLVVRPVTGYQDGIPRSWSRVTKEDYFDTSFQNLGAQEILNKEIYAAHPQPNDVFGYVDHDEDYRTIPDRTAGDFRTILDFWHMNRKFSSPPALNGDFVTCTPTTRIFADTESDPLWIYVRNSITARRLVPPTSNPKLL